MADYYSNTMIKILITFDYEIPLGKVSSYQKGLFAPAERIINLGKEMNVPFVFFADIYSAIKFKEWDNKNYYQPFQQQINKAIQSGHDIQLHIHPHWLTSKYNNTTFSPSKDYSLGDFHNHSIFPIHKIIKDGIDHLTNICRESDVNYKCTAFRAGGYSILKNSKAIFSALKANDIKIDSSILPNYFVKAPSHTVDFKTIKLNTWHIDPEQDIYTNANEGILEIPITNMPVNLIYIAKRRLKKLLNNKRITNNKYKNTGSGLLQGQVKKNIYERIRFFKNPVALSFDNANTTINDLDQIVNYNIKKFGSNSTLYITTISHPKFFGNYNLDLLKEFILLMKDKYSDEVEFVTYSSLT